MNEKSVEILLYNIAWLREHNKLSKKKMAKILDISVKSLNKIENGVLPPKISVKIIFNICDFFEIKPKKLFEEKICHSER
ncbi:MAG: helix-turn-helix transcriptional regulator [Clostridia bacterium]|nr:helix-turn-helix transcriptional regulator [Clostridia bacterium]